MVPEIRSRDEPSFRQVRQVAVERHAVEALRFKGDEEIGMTRGCARAVQVPKCRNTRRRAAHPRLAKDVLQFGDGWRSWSTRFGLGS